MLDPELLETFAFGYGNPDAPIWLVGMEESGGATLEDAQRRMLAWAKRGRRAFEDVADYHREINDRTRFEGNPTIQPTWGKLLRLLLAFGGTRNITREEVRDYQQNQFGREKGQELLAELYPLPSPGKNIWRYNEYSALPWLRDRATYQEHLFEYRTTSLRRLISSHIPKAVVFYGKGEISSWQAIADTRLELNLDLGILTGKRDETLFVITNHPVSIGATNMYFERIGEYLRSNP